MNNTLVYVGIIVLTGMAVASFWAFKTTNNKTWLELAIGNAGTLLITANKLVADMIMASLDENQPMSSLITAAFTACAAGVAVYVLFNYSANHIDSVNST